MVILTDESVAKEAVKDEDYWGVERGIDAVLRSDRQAYEIYLAWTKMQGPILRVRFGRRA